MDEETGKLEVVKEIIPTDQSDELRYNDGGVDAKGRFCSRRSINALWHTDQLSFLKVMVRRKGGFSDMILMGACI